MNNKKSVPLTILIITLMNACLQATTFGVMATDPNAGPLAQDNYIAKLFQQHPEVGLDLNDPNQPAVLGPVTADPNVWDVPCGPWRRGGTYRDPEGMTVSVIVVASNLEGTEATTTDDGTWTLTVPFVVEGWHYVRVRATDEPPATSDKASSRDVEVWFNGVPGPNYQPVLY